MQAPANSHAKMSFWKFYFSICSVKIEKYLMSYHPNGIVTLSGTFGWMSWLFGRNLYCNRPFKAACIFFENTWTNADSGRVKEFFEWIVSGVIRDLNHYQIRNHRMKSIFLLDVHFNLTRSPQSNFNFDSDFGRRIYDLEGDNSILRQVLLIETNIHAPMR